MKGLFNHTVPVDQFGLQVTALTIQMYNYICLDLLQEWTAAVSDARSATLVASSLCLTLLMPARIMAVSSLCHRILPRFKADDLDV